MIIMMIIIIIMIIMIIIIIIESDVVAIDPNSGLTSLTINEEVDLDDDDDY